MNGNLNLLLSSALLLCFVAMEPPHTIEADAVRDEKLKVLRSLRPLDGEAALAATIKARYEAPLREIFE